MTKVHVEKTVITEDLTYCIVRTYSAGVFAGWVDMDEAEENVTVKDARRIYYWDGAATLSQLATDGTSKPQNCKFPPSVPEIRLTNAIEFIPCTAKAKASIESVKEWRA